MYKTTAWDTNPHDSNKTKSFTLRRAGKYIKTYVKRVGYPMGLPTHPDAKEALFLRAADDYKKGELSLDELSVLCEDLWWSIEDKDSELARVLMSGQELSFYERQAVNHKHVADNLIGALKDVLAYKKQ